MATQYTSILKLALPVQGELSGTWGDVVNDNITSMVEEAIAGRAVINTWTANSHTLTTADGTTSESRAAILTLTDTGTALTGAGTVICPAASKIYIVENGTGQTITVKTASGTGIAVPNTKNMVVFCDGTNVEEGITNINSLTLNGDGATVSSIKDEDNMSSDSATALATQQSIKAYVDSQVGANNELSEVLANGNTTGGTDISVSSGDDITFADSSKAIFGAGSDLQIYHDGTNSYIDDTSAGNLVLRGNPAVSIQKYTGEVSGVFNADGAVNLYYDNALKLATTSTGIDVTGTAVTDGLTVDTAIATSTASFRATTNSTTIGQKIGSLDFFNGTTNAAGTLEVRRASGGNAYSDMALMASANGNRSNQLLLSTNGDITFYDTDGSTSSFVYDASAGLTINEAGADRDFRVESDSNANMLFVDGGANKVGIGVVPVEGALTIKSAGNTYATSALVLEDTDSTTRSYITHVNGDLAISNNGSTDQLVINAAGEATFNDLINIGGDSLNFTKADGVRINAKESLVAVIDSDNNDSGRVFQVQTGADQVLMTLAEDSGAVFNEGSADLDFRVESSASTHAIFVDAGNDNVGLFTSAPATALDVRIGGEGTPPSTVAPGLGAGIFLENNSGAASPYFASKTHNPGDSTAIGGVKFATSPDGANYNWAGVLAENSASGNAGRLRFYTSNANNSGDASTLRMSIMETGRVGINVSAPIVPFAVAGTPDTDYGVANFSGGDGNETFLTLSRDGSQTGGFKVLRGTTADLRLYVQSDEASVLNYNGGNTGDSFNIVQGAGTGALVATFDSGNNIIFNENSGDQDFRVESDSNANMFCVNAGNNRVGIGTNSGTANLQIFESANKNESEAHFQIQGAGYSGFHWLDGAAYYIGQNSAARNLRLYSGAETAGVNLAPSGTSWGTFSDERLKYDVEPIENALQSISALRTVKYRLDGVDSPDDKKKLGVIAQDLVGVYDEVIDPMTRSGDDTEYMGVRYTELVPVLIKAMQEQTEIINDLRARVAQLENT